MECFQHEHTGRICHPVLPTPDLHINETEARFKYIDDMAIAQVFPLSFLGEAPDTGDLPVNFRDRTRHMLPPSNNLQKKIKELEKFCSIQQMKINEKKTQTAVFNTAISKDCYPRLSNSSGFIFDNTEEFKLLGVDITTDQRTGVRWDTFIKKCIQKAYLNMWILRRLAELGVSIEDLLMTYTERIRIMVEQHVALWSFAISKSLIWEIEKVQKVACFIILGKHSSPSYLCNLAILDLEPLEVRRETLCKNLATKIFKHPVHRNMYTFKEGRDTRAGRKVVVPSTSTKRYETSSIPSLAKMINSL